MMVIACAFKYASVEYIQEDQSKINNMVAEYERTHPEEEKVQSVNGK